MGLRIVPASEPIKVEQLVVTIYSPPGIGKTSLGFSADSPLVLDADAGAYRSAFRGDSVQPQSWSEIADITQKDVAPYKTLVQDTAGRALDLLSADIIAGNAKLGRGGALTLQGYGELKSRYAAYLKLMRSFGLDIVLLAHSDEKQQGDDIVERIDMQGSSKQEVYKVSDAMARLSIVNGQRVLTFSPSETTFGKDPAGLGRVSVPDLADQRDFLGSVIRQIKESLNTLSAEQKAAAEAAVKEAAAWDKKVAACKEADDFTALTKKAKDRSQKVKLLEAAGNGGFEWDATAEKFVALAGAEV